MKQTIANRIKEELFNADMEYAYALAAFRAKCPNGVNFCFKTVSSEEATAAMQLSKAEAKFNAIVSFVRPRLERSAMEALTESIIARYNGAETDEAAVAAQKDYFDLYSIV